MIRKWDISDEQTKKRCVDELLTRIDEQGDAEFGMIAAEELIDIVAEHVGPEAYNKGIEDAKKLLQNKLADIEVDLDVLKTRS